MWGLKMKTTGVATEVPTTELASKVSLNKLNKIHKINAQMEWTGSSARQVKPACGAQLK